MLTKRIIPCLDVRNGRVVKGKKFQDVQDVEDPVSLAKFYRNEMADELVFYDITASNEKRDIFLNVVEKTAEQINIPFTIGGGIRSVEDFNKVLKAGADKVSVNTAAVLRPELIREAALKFGNQCVMLSMDVKWLREGKWTIYINGGRVDTGIDALEWAKKGVALGAGEICLNAIDSDGVKEGYSIELTRLVSESVNVPVIASGGAGKKEHFLEVFEKGKADAALAASVFHYKEIKIDELKEYLENNGVPMRRRLK
ncbi:MAG: imidazole glycerol phosphate synthase subunit HisF [Peptostreptococcaceae bacterium]|nr:imidazole glycerol phosphate synthase subunit HisF [Peptostreptococcaceae bacterium]